MLEAEAILAKAQAEAKAIQMKLEAEAEGKKKSLLAEAEGFEAMVKAAERNPEIAIQYKMVDQWKEIASEQVKAFEHIQLGNITVFDGGKVWIKIFPDKPVTEKPAETRMGSGKGSPEYWVAVVKPGRVLFELADVDEATAREALRLAMHKLPIKCKFVVREDSVKEDGTNEG